eukprot:759523-Hanusia_phi.AAC.2
MIRAGVTNWNLSEFKYSVGVPYGDNSDIRKGLLGSEACECSKRLLLSPAADYYVDCIVRYGKFDRITEIFIENHTSFSRINIEDRTKDTKVASFWFYEGRFGGGGVLDDLELTSPLLGRKSQRELNVVLSRSARKGRKDYFSEPVSGCK